MKRNILFFATVFAFATAPIHQANAQPSGQVYSKNVALLSQSLFGGFTAGNLTYWRDPSTGNSYALVTIDEGLSSNV